MASSKRLVIRSHQGPDARARMRPPAVSEEERARCRAMTARQRVLWAKNREAEVVARYPDRDMDDMLRGYARDFVC